MAAPPLGATVAPLAVGATKVLAVQVERQQRTLWCWAAVAQGVARYYSTHGGSAFGNKQQCEIAGHVLGMVAKQVCDSEQVGNLEVELNLALLSLDHFQPIPGQPLDPNVTQILSEAHLMGEIDGGYPVGCRIRWATGNGHFVLLIGYRVDPAGQLHVWLCDPRNPIGTRTLCPYSTLKNGYSDGSGVQGGWTHAILTKPAPK